MPRREERNLIIEAEMAPAHVLLAHGVGGQELTSGGRGGGQAAVSLDNRFCCDDKRMRGGGKEKADPQTVAMNSAIRENMNFA